MAAYPDPPWHTHGRAYLAPYLVDASTISVPAPLERVQAFGRATGLLGYVVYEPPSPLVYRELFWLPCLVRGRTDDGRMARGFFVDRMYVDDEDSLAAGREVWALPKQRARFEERDGRVRIETDDGLRLELALRTTALAVPAASRTTTLQVRDGRVIRFVGATERASTSPGGLSVRSSSGTSVMQGFDGAVRLPALGVSLVPFRTTMRPPT